MDKSQENGSDKTEYDKIMQPKRLLSCYCSPTKAFNDEHKTNRLPSHHELFFVTAHQVIELWLRQLNHEIDSIKELFQQIIKDERKGLDIVRRLRRCCEILKSLEEHISRLISIMTTKNVSELVSNEVAILNTMHTVEFFEFRSTLGRGSGFQSKNFRLLENKLGLKRKTISSLQFILNSEELAEYDQESVMAEENKSSLRDVVELWLENSKVIQFVFHQDNFWKKFTNVVTAMLKANREIAEQRNDDSEEKVDSIRECEKMERWYDSLFDPEKHKACIERGERNFSLQAFRAVIAIYRYRYEMRFQVPFMIINLLQDLDQAILEFRCNKSGLAQTSGYTYLKATTGERLRVFVDLINISSFLIEDDKLPDIPEDLFKKLNFPPLP
ncbi:Tryptophan 2,3-dioxygenase [Trichoplax sp. H2]|nr:Tryptophan 2,3-dioxygenase [Trichoplax sp. H2]|eukprot:RDD42477.1 Tryptophan 2,3-dioxygenase [Trichoplax sp. H2]